MSRVAGCVALLALVAACGVGPGGAGEPSGRPSMVQAAPAAEHAGQPPMLLPPDAVGAELRRLGEAGGKGPRAAKARAELASLYAPDSPDAPAALWLDATGRPTANAADALALLASSDAHGLVPGDYRALDLAHEARLLTSDSSPEARVQFDVTLSLQVVRYWRDLHLGRVDPRALGFRLNAPVDDHDFAALLRAAVAGKRLGAATNELVPPLVLYRSLVTVLERYRELAPRSRPVDLPVPRRSFKPGDAVEGLASLRDRLVLVGDLAPDAPLATPAYEGPLVDGVKRFQGRHGLDPDGALGRSTLAALQVPLAARVEQLTLALERLRWLPHLDETGFLAVNIPMFRLWGWGRVPPDGAPAFDMSVIVGRALITKTPVFSDEIRYIIFRPYWNVPPSILRGEVLPAIAKNPAYLARNDMEIVDGPGDDARVVAASEETLARLRQGQLRVRQRPGPKNSLGLVKFVFPNDDNIYMHGTPAPQLFGRARRDFSHGCVRVEDPVKLAEWLLRDKPEWTRARILAAMEAQQSERVDLARPVQVILFYLTAVVLPEDGSVHFADDIYGHDRKLATALARRAD